jgi:hypothetical protein
VGDDLARQSSSTHDLDALRAEPAATSNMSPWPMSFSAPA